MTIAAADPTRRTREVRLLWLLLIANHLIVGWVASWHPHTPLNDVTSVYRGWIDAAERGMIPGVDSDFVYPVGSLLPMFAAHILGGHERFTTMWVLIVLALNCWALWWLTHRQPRATDAPLRLRAARFFVLFLIALGPIAIGRIDAITIPVTLVGLLLLREQPLVAGALFTIGAWLKVWPAALFAAAVVALKSRWQLVVGATIVCAAVGVFVLVAGGFEGLRHAASFVTEQTGRGLQVESSAANLFLLASALGASGYLVRFDTEILTQQISGPGTAFVSSLLTLIMFVMVAVVLGLGLLAARRGMPLASRLPMMALALVTVFIVWNKVGSPQFISWLAPVVVLLLVWEGRQGNRVAVVAVAIAAITQLVYPWFYGEIVAGSLAGALLLLIRNGLIVGLMCWSIWRLARAAFAPRGSGEVEPAANERPAA